MAKFDLTGKEPKVYNPNTRNYDVFFVEADNMGDYKKVEYRDDGKHVEYGRGKSINMDQGYIKHSSGAMREKMQNLRYDYMPAKMVNEAYARIADFGAKKYDTDNWMKGLPQSQIAASLQRHLWAYFDGEDVDAESNLSHIDHVLWNAIALLYHKENNLEDDRFDSRRVSK